MDNCPRPGTVTQMFTDYLCGVCKYDIPVSTTYTTWGKGRGKHLGENQKENQRTGIRELGAGSWEHYAPLFIQKLQGFDI